MSWNPFSRSSSSAPKKTVLSRANQREFEREVKRLDELEELTRRLYKDGKRLTEANNAVAKSERKLSQELLSTALCQTEEKFKWQITEWDASMVKMDMHMTDRNVKLHRTVLEPLKKLRNFINFGNHCVTMAEISLAHLKHIFSLSHISSLSKNKYVSIFPYAQVAVKKRDQCLQEFQKCQDKVSKYQERDRTGQNAVKLDMAKKTLGTAQADFTSQNDALMADVPKMIDTRTDYFQPSLEADIKSEVQYTTEAVKVYGELSNLMNGHKQQSRHDYASLIQQALTELKALSITTD